jgi:RNA polymerase sigma-70 factor, ECF subfamily
MTRDLDHWCAELYEVHAVQLILYGRALGLSHGEAEDVLQETFLALMQLGRQPEKPAHYCLRSYRNRALNYRRGFWRRLRRELESSRWFERSEATTQAEAAAMRCLPELPAAQREVIVLKIWHGHTFEEIGELLGLSPNTVAGRYRYGMQKLRTFLEGSDYEQREHCGETTGVVDTPETFDQAQSTALP